MSSDSPNNQDERKIIIDEDWKSQVEREREELKRTPEADPKTDSPVDRPEPQGQLPPASLPLLVSTLATQAMAAMGQIPDPLEKRPIVRLDLARHHIDMLGLIEAKTKGNVTDEEGEMLESVLHELRLVYVAVEKQVQEST